MLACVGGAVFAGCTVNPGGEGSSSSGSRTSGASTTSSTSTASPTTPPFGSDVTIPADGVGSARTTDADDWTMTNELDNAYAQVLSPVAAPALAVDAQAAIGDWLSRYRSGGFTPTGSASSSPSTSWSATAPASNTVRSPATTATSSPTGTSTTPAATETPAASGRDSFRVLSQVVAARPDVSGLRLYGRITADGSTREVWRVFWFDATSNQIVDGTALFATARTGQDPLSTARQLAIAAAPTGNLGAVSDRDLFESAAFTTGGDLVLYVPQSGSDPLRVTLSAGQVEPLLSALGQQAKVAAADAIALAPTGSPTATATTPSAGATTDQSGSPSMSPTNASTASSSSTSG